MSDSTPHEIELAAEADARAKRARDRVGDAHPEDPTKPVNTSSTANKHFDSSYQSLLFGSAGTIAKPAWSDSTKGRLAIRMFSRGIMGAALFTIGGRISRAQMLDYDPHTFEWSQAKAKPLQALAKIFDEGFGKPIAAIAASRVNTTGMTAAEAKFAKANAEWDATMFRSASYYHSTSGKMDHKHRPMNGRSLGSEMVNVSFDFAMMSVGDGMGRNFVQMIDPHIRKTWMLNDKGEKAKEGEKAHFSASKFAQSWGRSAWRIISKNQGEDWAVALPYVYQMRWQRKMLSKAFGHDKDGIKVVFDHAWNGAAYKVNNEGKIIGDYQLAGAMDLHGRFVGYNVLTLMYREGYDALGHTLKKWKEDGYQIHAPKHVDPVKGTVDAVRYGVKSFIKANLYMNPAVIPFWVMRVPQTKWRGALINTDLPEGINAIASTVKQSERVATALGHKLTIVPYSAPHAFTVPHSPLKSGPSMLNKIIDEVIVPAHHNTPAVFNYNAARHRILPGAVNQPATMYFGDHSFINPLHGMDGPHDWRHYDHYKGGFGTTFSKMLNPFGQASNWLGGKLTALSNKLPEGSVKNFVSLEDRTLLLPKGQRVGTAGGREQFMRTFVDASMAYTPYFFAKSELGLRVDDTPPTGGRGKMDNAIYGLIDNVVAVNPSKAGASVKEIWHLSTHREKVVMREGSHNNPENHIVQPKLIPNTIIHAEGRVKEEMHKPAIAPQVSEAEQSDKGWAESVTRKDLTAQFQPNDSPTRH